MRCDTSSNTPDPDRGYFVKFFGADGNQVAVDLLVDSDGTIFILGNSIKSNSAKQQVYLAKASALGSLELDTLLTSSKVYSEARDLEFTNDGQLVLVANQIDSVSGDMNILVQKISKDVFSVVGSKILWSKVAASPDPYSNPHKNDYVNSITPLANGNYILTGFTDNAFDGHQFDILNLQVDPSLNKITTPWGETTGAGTENYGRKVIERIQALPSPDTVRYVFGNTNAGGTSQNIWYAELPNNGYGAANPDNQSDAVFYSQLTNDYTSNVIEYEGGYLITSVSTPLSSGNSALKLYNLGFNFLTANNSSEITAVYDWPIGNILNVNAISSKASIGYLVVADYPKSSSDTDILFLRLSGSFSSPIYFGGEGADHAAAVAELPDGHVLILGTMELGNPPEQFKIALIKVNANGKFEN